MQAENYIEISRYIGAGLAIGLGAIGSAVGEGYAAREATRGIARQPSDSGSILRYMLVGQAVTETPAIFALVMAVLLIFASKSSGSIIQAAAYVSTGLCIGLSTLGCGAGSGIVAGDASRSMSINPRGAGRSVFSMLIGQALSQSTVVYALVIALILWLMDFGYAQAPDPATSLTTMSRLLGAGICAGAGAIGPGLGSAVAGAYGSYYAGRYSESSGAITRTMLIGSAVAQTTSIYALVVAILLLFVVS